MSGGYVIGRGGEWEKVELVGNEVEPDYIGLGSQGTLRGHCGWLVKNGVRGGGECRCARPIRKSCL